MLALTLFGYKILYDMKHLVRLRLQSSRFWVNDKLQVILYFISEWLVWLIACIMWCTDEECFVSQLCHVVCDTAQEAASLQQKRGNLQHYGATFDMLLSDILDHYRTFGMLERYLKNPSKMAGQLELQIASHTQSLLIEKSVTSA